MIKEFTAYKLIICSIKWFRKKGKSVAAIKICFQISLMIISEGNLLIFIPFEIASLGKIEPTDVILVHLLLVLNKFHTLL